MARLRSTVSWTVLALAGCELSMPIGDLRARGDADADADSDGGADADADVDTDGDVEACAVGIDRETCRVLIPLHDQLSVGAPVAADEPLHTSSWTFTSLQSDSDGLLYAFFWWVSAEEIDAEVPTPHLAWRTRAPDEESWSELRAVPGVTAEQLRDAQCSAPSQAPLEFAATDDGYVHAFWRKNASCRGGDLWFVEHAMFEAGEIAYREEMPIGCDGGRDLQMKDALGRPGGEVLVAFLCGSDGLLQTFSCGCWSESSTVPDDGFVEVQDDLQLVDVGGEPWIVVRQAQIHDLWARRLDDPGAFLRVSDDTAVVGSSVPFVDHEGVLWVAWQSESIPSTGVSVARLEDSAFEATTDLPGGTTLVHAFDALDVPGRGPTILTEESLAIPGEGGAPNLVRDEFWVRSYADGAWSAPVLAALSEVEVEGVLARHSASDLAVAADRAWIAYVTYVGGDLAYTLSVVELP